MSTEQNLDEQMDARLQAAGARWRDAHTSVGVTDGGSDLVDMRPDSSLDHRRSRRVYWLAAASAAAVIAVVAGVLLAVGLGNSPRHPLSAGQSNPHGPGPAPAAQPLIGTTWYLTRYEFGKATGNGYFVLHISAAGRLTAGPQDCGTLTANAVVTAQRLTISHVSALPGVCPAQVDDLSQKALSQVDQLLQGSLTWRVTPAPAGPDVLTLSSPAGTLTFLGGQPTVAPPWAGGPVTGSWRLSTFRYQGHSQRVAQPAELTIRAGHLRATGLSCNTRTAVVTVQHGSLVLTDIHTTRRPCPTTPNQAAADEDQVLYTVLTGTVQWSVHNGQLSLVKNSRNALTYRR